ncbi:putative prophage-encoded outer membrane protein [Escherichia coli]|nr:putative prophage-encoded outer membrane protein [Escherichia coli]
MRKLCAVILSAVVWLVAAGTPASAAEHQSTLSAGYLQTHTDMPGSDDLKGINVKYRYEFTDTLGLVTSFSYANAKDEQKTHYSDTRWHEDSVRNRWFSMMAGPSVRVNEWFSAYAMAGVAYSRVSTFSGDYLRVTDSKGKTHDVLTGSDDGRHSNTSLAWGAGVQFNPTESVAIDIAYEGSGSGWPSGTITVRVYDDQPFDRQIVIPAVAFSGAKHEREHTDIYSSCRLIVRKNGAEIYNRTALDNTLIYSGVIDMPAGHGHMTLEFSVSAWLVNDWYPTASISDLLVVVMKKATAGISIS